MHVLSEKCLEALYKKFLLKGARLRGLCGFLVQTILRLVVHVGNLAHAFKTFSLNIYREDITLSRKESTNQGDEYWIF